jgi:predicted nuclease of predicted toxin-antitoxin system
VRFVIDADLPRATQELLRKYGHEAIDVRDIGLGAAEDPLIAQFAREQNACILTGDFGFSNVNDYPPHEYHGIVVLELPRDATARFILNLIESFLRNQEVLSLLPRRLAIVEAGRVRLRPKD